MVRIPSFSRLPSGPQAEDIKRIAFEGDSSSSTGAPAGGRAGLGVPWRSSDATRREASVVLIDRTLDLAAPASHGGSLLQRVRYHDEGLVLYEWSFTTVEAKRGGRVVRVRLDYFSLVGLYTSLDCSAGCCGFVWLAES